MLLSMTGFGEARGIVGGAHVSAEIRSVNNRHFKLTMRCPDTWSRFEPEIEKTLREQISRGTVSLFLRRERSWVQDSQRINATALSQYWTELKELTEKIGAPTPTNLSTLLTLPGVIESADSSPVEAESLLPELLELVRNATYQLQQFRQQEGAAMAADLLAQAATINREVEQITQYAPQVAIEYRSKLQQRIQEAVSTAGLKLEHLDLVREVALFTDRSDISEELVRLRSHLEQFEKLMNAENSQGRKLDFLCQELFREANTIGSKANHIGVSHAAVEMKTAIERMREVVQNVE